jgi:hypothetical protein
MSKSSSQLHPRPAPSSLPPPRAAGARRRLPKRPPFILSWAGEVGPQEGTPKSAADKGPVPNSPKTTVPRRDGGQTLGGGRRSAASAQLLRESSPQDTSRATASSTQA